MLEKRLPSELHNSPKSADTKSSLSPSHAGRPSPVIAGNTASAALVTPGADGSRGAEAAYRTALQAAKAEVLVPEVHFTESGATSLLDASPKEIQQLGGPLAVATNEALMATVPDGTRDNMDALAAWDAEDSDLDAAEDSDDELVVQDALTGEGGPRKQLQQAPVPLPPGVNLSEDQLAQLESAVERHRFLNKYLPAEFDSWSEFVAARGAVKRPHKARKAMKAVNQRVLDARISPAPRTPIRGGVAPRYLQFGYGDADAEGGQGGVKAPPSLPGAGSLSWGRQLTPPKGETHRSASGGRPMSRRQRRISQAIHDALTGILASPSVTKGFDGIVNSSGVALEITQVYVTADLGTAYVYWAVPGQLEEDEAMGGNAGNSASSCSPGMGASYQSAFMARQVAAGSPALRRAGGRGGSATARLARRAQREDDVEWYSVPVQARIRAAAADLRRLAPKLVQELQTQLGLKRAVALKMFRALPSGSHGSVRAHATDELSPEVRGTNAAGVAEGHQQGSTGSVWGSYTLTAAASGQTTRRWAEAHRSRANLDEQLQSRIVGSGQG